MASDDYTIGWICALPIEKVAARAMLDDIHHTAFIRAASDQNSYTLGRIGPHNIVVASLPSGIYGETQRRLRSHDIRLGDVVVSRPEGTLGGVVQFDRGKTTADGRFVRTGVLNKPPLVLLNAVAELEAEHEMQGSKAPRMREGYSCQDPVSDVLYQAEYNHSDENDLACASKSEVPMIHYGIIASSNQVVKDSVLRDRIGAELGAIGLEMEAAGIMDSFPCIVIRGVSDYADSHKNKRWQRYAAATAAAYAKELLHKVPPSELSASHTALHVLRSKLTARSQSVKHKVYLDALPVAEGAAFDSYDNESSSHCHPETRTELLRQINEWSSDPNGKSIFWLNGMAGTGKSTIARTVARSFSKDARLAASFFFKRGEASRGDASRLFTTIASQIAANIPESAEHIQQVVRRTPLIADKGLGIQFSELILKPLRRLQITSEAPNVVVLDALNECDDAAEVRSIIHLFSGSITEGVNLRVFVTSRPDTAIRIGFSQLAHGVYDRLILHDVAQEAIDHDIRVVLVDEMRRTVHDYNAVAPPDAVLPPDWPGPERIDRLVEIASPPFISAATICRFLGDPRFSPNHQLEILLEHRSASHASKLDFTYLPILEQILEGELTKRERDYLISEFHGVVGPLVILAEPLSTFHLARLLSTPKNRVDASLGLLHAVLSIPEDQAPVRLFHASFRDFLLDEGLPEKPPFAIDGPTTHRHLLQRCLDRMSRTAQPMGLSHNVYGPTVSMELDVSFEEGQPDESLPADLRYSCLYWVHHLQQAKGSIQVGDAVHSFLQSDFLNWVQTLGILRKPSEVLQSVQTLGSLVAETGNGSVLSQFLIDARRFVYGHKPAIERIPRFIKSSVIFLPRSSSIRQSFIHHKPAWIMQLPDVPLNWGQPSLHIDGFVLDCLAFAQDGSRLASEFRVWDATSGHVLRTLSRYQPKSTVDRMKNYQNGVKALAFPSSNVTGARRVLQLGSAINDAVFSGDASKLAFIASSNPFEASTRPLQEPSVSVRDNTTGHIILKIDRNAQVEIFGLNRYSSLKRNVIFVPFAHVAMITLSPDGQKLAAFGEEESTRLVLVMDIETGDRETMFLVSEWITCMSFSRDATALTVVVEKKEFLLFDLVTGQVQMIRKHCRHDVVAFAPDVLRIATAPRTADGIEIWNSLINPDNMLCQKRFLPLEDCLPLFSLSPDGSVAATADTQSNRVLLVDVASKEITHELPMNGVPEAVAFSRDGTIMAAKTFCYMHENQDDSDTDPTFGELDDLVVIDRPVPTSTNPSWLEIWKIESTPSIRFLKGFPMAYRKVLLAVHPSGLRVAFVFLDDTQARGTRTTMVEEWDVIYGDLIHRHYVHQQAKVSKIQYSAGGETIELDHYKDSGTQGITTTTRIRTWQLGYTDMRSWDLRRVSANPLPKWRFGKHDFPRTGIWVTEDEAWIRYDSQYILYIPAHLRPMQHVYLGTSFDSVCNDDDEEAVVGWITVESLFTTFRIDLKKLRLAINGVGAEG
ncbi:hypothetical protein BJY00DRAFT_327116 [Aspergillus carlsbadensis]|nr:hypothetical protein BJY00DRAFT_327116 [Aspergillus carlsbadensis]